MNKKMWFVTKTEQESTVSLTLLCFRLEQGVRRLSFLDDASVDRLYHDSLRAYADSIRRAPGVLA